MKKDVLVSSNGKAYRKDTVEVLPDATSATIGQVATKTANGVEFIDPYMKSGGAINGDVTMARGKWLSFVDQNGTFPTLLGGFKWTLNNDEAKIYAYQPSPDLIDFVFELADNVDTTDRFVFKTADYRGSEHNVYQLYMDGRKAVFNYPDWHGATGASKDFDFYIMGINQPNKDLSNPLFKAVAATNRIGINNGNPTEALDIFGNLKVSGTAFIGRSLIGNGADSGDIFQVTGTSRFDGVTKFSNSLIRVDGSYQIDSPYGHLIKNSQNTSENYIFEALTNGSTRWLARTFNPESANNAGGDLGFSRYSNTGAYLGEALTIQRATGVSFFSSEIYAKRKMYIAGDATQNNGEARYHLYNGGGMAEWKFGQKATTNHQFSISKVVGATETDYFVINQQNGFIGFNTNAPATSLHIIDEDTPIITVGTSTLGKGGVYFGNSNHGVIRNYKTGNDIGLFTTSGDVYLSANNRAYNQFVLKQNGNIGIGTATPTKKIDVQMPHDGGTEIETRLVSAWNTAGNLYGFGMVYGLTTADGTPYRKIKVYHGGTETDAVSFADDGTANFKAISSLNAANLRVIQNKGSIPDGLFIGFDNAGGSQTRIYDGSTTNFIGISAQTFYSTNITRFLFGNQSDDGNFAQVGGGLSVKGNLGINGNITQTGADFLMRCSSRGVGGRAIVHDTGNTLHFNYAGDFTGGVMISGQHLFTSSGNLGLGTFSPLEKLHVAGSMQLGVRATGVGTTTPIFINLGNTYSSVAGANPKIKLYDDASGYTCGFGVSAGSIDYMTNNVSVHSFYLGNTKAAQVALDALSLPVDGYAIRFVNGGTNGTIQSNGGTFTLSNDAGTANTDRLILKSTVGNVVTWSPNVWWKSATGITAYAGIMGGNFLINQTVNAGFKLDVNGTSRFTDNLFAAGNLTVGSSTYNGYKMSVVRPGAGNVQIGIGDNDGTTMRMVLGYLAGGANSIDTAPNSLQTQIITDDAGSLHFATRKNIANQIVMYTSNGTANIEALRILSSGRIKLSNCPVFSDNSAATTAGLTAGEIYKNSVGVLMIVY